VSYFKMLGYYLCEAVSSVFNLGFALFGSYPCYELGVQYLLMFEGRRIVSEKEEQFTKREKRAQEAEKLEEKARILDQ